MSDRRKEALEWFKSQYLPKGNNTGEVNQHVDTILELLEPTPLEVDAEYARRFLFGTHKGDNGFIGNLCYTIWRGCHYPTHEDGNFDWGNDSLPYVEKGKQIIQEKMEIMLKGVKHD